MLADPAQGQTLTVLAADSFRVSDGVARGEAMSFADELVLDDIYELSTRPDWNALVLAPGADERSFVVQPESKTGTAGNLVILDCCVTLMRADGSTIELLVLVEVDASGEAVADLHLLPLAALQDHTDYRLVGIDRHTGTARLAEVACVSFTRGTRITLASGRQVPVEDLRVGDRILTRDDGAQPLRWIGQTTLRAVGAFAPVRIAKGALHNADDLYLSPDHRVFVWQRHDRLGAGRSEVLVKVRHLVNGDTVRQVEGGFVDYFQLLFDDHQIIFAEGIAAESLLVDPRTRAAIPADLVRQSHDYRRHQAYEVQESLLPKGDAAEILRRASQSG